MKHKPKYCGGCRHFDGTSSMCRVVKVEAQRMDSANKCPFYHMPLTVACKALDLAKKKIGYNNTDFNGGISNGR